MIKSLSPGVDKSLVDLWNLVPGTMFHPINSIQVLPVTLLGFHVGFHVDKMFV